MKNSSFYFTAEYKKDGYDVSNRKYFNPYYDKAIMINLLDEVTKWLNKMNTQEVLIDIMGNGLKNSFCQSSVCRIIKRYSYQMNTAFEFTVIWFNQTGEDTLETYSTKKEAYARFKELFVRNFPDQMTIEG